jgi:hypothetical protein
MASEYEAGCKIVCEYRVLRESPICNLYFIETAAKMEEIRKCSI